MTAHRVLHVNKLYWPWIGGIEGVVQSLAEETCGWPGWEAEVLACQPGGASAEEIINRVKVRRVASAGMAWSLPIAPAFPAALRRIRRDFDVVHVHVPFPLAIFSGWSRSRSGPRLVIHYHCEVTRPLHVAVMRMLEPMNRAMLSSADRIIVTSENLLRAAKHLKDFEDRCRIVPLPVDLTSVRPALPEQVERGRKRWGISECEKVVLFVGRLVPYKGLEYLLEAMRGIAAKLLVVGDGPLRSSLERLVLEKKLKERILFTGKVDNAEVSDAYSIADVFVLPSIDPAEAFGVVQLEAMAHGCPVVNTSLPTGVPEVSLHGITGLTVRPRDSDALADALKTLLADDALRKRYGDAARERALQFDRKMVGAKVRDVYLEALALRGDS